MGRDFIKEYNNSERNKDLNMMEYGLLKIKTCVIMLQRDFITKSEYKVLRRQIETQLFRI